VVAYDCATPFLVNLHGYLVKCAQSGICFLVSKPIDKSVTVNACYLSNFIQTCSIFAHFKMFYTH